MHKKSRKKDMNNKKIEDKNIKKKRLFGIKNLISKNSLSKALSEVDRYLEDYPNDSYGLIQKANILTILTYYDDANEILDIVIENNLEGRFSAMYKRGIIAQIQNDKETAEALFRRNIEESPHPEIYSRMALANLEYDKGNYDNSFLILDGYYDRKVNGEDVANLFHKFGYSEIKDVEFLALSKIIKLISLERKKEARKIYDTINVDGSNVKLLREFNLVSAKINRLEDNYEEALEYLRKISNGLKDRIYCDAKEEEARLILKLGDPLGAIEICEQILDNDFVPNPAFILEIIGNAYVNLRKYDQARKTFLKMNSFFSDEKELLGNFNLGKLEYKLGNYEEALKYFENLKFKKDRNQQYLEFYLAKLYLRKKLNKLINEESYIHSYTRRQIVNYSEEEALKDIDKIHTKDGNASVFDTEIDLKDLMKRVPTLLKQDSTIIMQNIFSELYQVEYPGVGYTGNGETNTFNVAMLPTGDIITMYPCDSINVSKGGKGSNKKQVKTSQIAKFNNRYSGKM